MSATAVATAMIAVPLVAAFAGFLLPLPARRAAYALGVAGAAVALILSIVLAATVGGGVDEYRDWVHFGRFTVTLGIQANHAVAFVAIAVGVVALAVQVYSVRYLDRDDRYPPYAAQISLFTAAMLIVLVSGDLITVLVGWEVMGACSYLLIAHDRTLPEAPAAAVKAFLVTRVGDVGFLLGIALIGVSTGTFRISEVIAHAPERMSDTRLTVACLLLLAGAIGKSAQFPLHTWLPDAMAGPTPISALIHAATMVAAGVIVLTRLAPLFLAAPGLLAVIAVIASITMLLAACAATAQDDIKRVLAWSTVSQVAYMFGGFAVGGSAPALFHLLTHAAFKALLFLAAGCVIHAVGTNMMSRMGGLRRAMPVTFVTMTIGLAALAGVPPFSGFFSKDAVLDAAWTAAEGHSAAPRWSGTLVLLAGFATVALTAWYATRLWLRTFLGDPRDEAAHPHDPPALMRWPVIVLAVPAALLGFLGLSPSFASALAGSAHDAFSPFTAATGVSLLLVALGIGTAWATWRRDTAADPARVFGPLRPLFADAFRGDAIQHALVVVPVRALAGLVARGDRELVDGAVEGSARGTDRAAGWTDTWHRGPLPRAAGVVAGGALVIALTALVVGGLR